MKIICAWCGKTLEDADGINYPVSHGICVRCAARVEWSSHLFQRWQHRPHGNLKKMLRRALRRAASK
jgi:hypothetical protein